MNLHRLLLIVGALAVLSACAAPRKPPPPVAAPAPRPAPLPPPPPPPPADWRDAPVSPGTWMYRLDPTAPVAEFGATPGQALLSLRCERAAGLIHLRRAGAAAGPVPLMITTTSARRSFTVAPEPGEPTALTLAIPARDSILDAMAFSRGRFMIEVPGLPTLYLPAWPEVARVVEDCR